PRVPSAEGALRRRGNPLRLPLSLGVARGLPGLDGVRGLPQGAPAGEGPSGHLPRAPPLRGLRGRALGPTPVAPRARRPGAAVAPGDRAYVGKPMDASARCGLTR